MSGPARLWRPRRIRCSRVETRVSLTSTGSIGLCRSRGHDLQIVRFQISDPVDAESALGVGRAEFRSALRRHPAGVTIVTLESESRPVGFTATSFASLSLDPPLVSFNITDTSSSIVAVRSADSLVIHLLGEHQQPLAERFARAAAERFSDETLWCRSHSGEPVLHGTPVWLRVLVHRLVPLGDSTLVVGLVVDVHESGDTHTPLLYHEGGYHRPIAVEA